MGDPFFDLGNFSINHELTADQDEVLLLAHDGTVAEARLARLTLMRVVSDFREAMWGVLQQGISTLDFDFRGYAAEHFDRLLANGSTLSNTMVAAWRLRRHRCCQRFSPVILRRCGKVRSCGAGRIASRMPRPPSGPSTGG